MKPFRRIGRRQFLHDSALSLGAAPLIAHAAFPEKGEAPAHPGLSQSGSASDSPALKMQARFGSTDTVWIRREPNSSFAQQLASCELARGLRNLGLAREPVQALVGGGEQPSSGFVFSLLVKKEAFKHPEAYEISHESGSNASRVRLTGATPQALLYAVFDFLERQGAFFGLDGEVYPLEPARTLNLPPPGHPWQAQPRFNVRGLVPWPDFLNCVTIYNREDWRAYLEAMVRMRFNTLGVHVYSGTNQWAESFLSLNMPGPVTWLIPTRARQTAGAICPSVLRVMEWARPTFSRTKSSGRKPPPRPGVAGKPKNLHSNFGGRPFSTPSSLASAPG